MWFFRVNHSYENFINRKLIASSKLSVLTNEKELEKRGLINIASLFYKVYLNYFLLRGVRLLGVRGMKFITFHS